MSDDMLTIELSAIKKQRGTSEFHTVPSATCDGITVSGHGLLIGNICSQLIEAGHQPDTPVRVVRGATVCFNIMTLDQWANPPKKPQPEQLRRAS